MSEQRKILDAADIIHHQASIDMDTLVAAAGEAECLLTNYLVNGHFPKGSDCEEVRDILRVALRFPDFLLPSNPDKVEARINHMFTLQDLYEASHSMARIDDKWVPARPMLHGFISRLRDAWAVLTGKADAFKWPGGQ